MKTDENSSILLEEYCDECDETVHQVFTEKAFLAHKVGRIRCPNCGHVILPCNECGDHDACGDCCPWRHAEIDKPMSDEAYIHYLRDFHPTVYEMFSSGECGDHYKGIIEKIEGESK